MKRLPFLLAPAAKDYLWGGNRMNDDFGKGIELSPLAETWECSTLPEGPSLVAGTGEDLRDVLSGHPDWLGTHPLATMNGRPELPILIKFIDAKKKLSVQVHPDDEYAAREGQLGKTEMWYVLDAGPGAELVCGFNRDMTPEGVRQAVEQGRIEQYLNHVPVEKNDLFFIEPGTVHAIGAGVLLAEIQEASSLTYRLYDYDRTDRHGRKRELHLEKALETANLKASAAPRQPMRLIRYQNGSASELLSRCRYFQVERLLLNTEGRRLAGFRTGSNSFHALLCIEGCGVALGEAVSLNFFQGDCIFVPADSIPLQLHGKAQLLDVSC